MKTNVMNLDTVSYRFDLITTDLKRVSVTIYDDDYFIVRNKKRILYRGNMASFRDREADNTSIGDFFAQRGFKYMLRTHNSGIMGWHAGPMKFACVDAEGKIRAYVSGVLIKELENVK